MKAKPKKQTALVRARRTAPPFSDNSPAARRLYQRVREILEQSRLRAARSVNTEMVRAYWLIGQVIVEQEQKGKSRADYGERLIESLSERLTADYGKGFTLTNLKYMRQFFLTFEKSHALRGELSWTHYRLLLKVENPHAREFYETEAVAGAWSTRQLERQINSFFYERAGLSKNKRKMLSEGRAQGEQYEAGDFIRDPYVLEFLGLRESPELNESEIESALLDHIQEFLLELGKGFSFVGRQVRITIDGDHFYIDLVLYNRLMRCFVLIDLKRDKLMHQDLGQMQLYTNWYSREMREEWENPAIGLLLCADKNDAVVRYTLPEDNRQIFASRYKLYLPSEEEIVAELRREQEALALRAKLSVGQAAG